MKRGVWIAVFLVISHNRKAYRGDNHLNAQQALGVRSSFEQSSACATPDRR